MAMNRNEIKRAVHLMMNDVVEQCFHHLVHHPQLSDPLNSIIRDASEEINYQVLKIDSHTFRDGSTELNNHYQTITKDVQRKSLELLSRLQKIQQEV